MLNNFYIYDWIYFTWFNLVIFYKLLGRLFNMEKTEFMKKQDKNFWFGCAFFAAFCVQIIIIIIIINYSKSDSVVSSIEKETELIRAQVFSNDTTFVRESSKKIDSLMGIIDNKVRSNCDHETKLRLFEVRSELDMYRTCNSAQKTVMEAEIAIEAFDESLYD